MPMNKSLQDWTLELSSITKGPHRFGGTEFQVHGLELMHTHVTSQLDIRLSKEDQQKMLEEGKGGAASLCSSSWMGHVQDQCRRRCRGRERVDSTIA